MSFLRKLWDGIKSLFQGLRIKSKVWVHLAIIVMQNIKTVMDSPVPDVLTSIIPGGADDAIKEKIRLWIPKVMLELNMIDAIANIEDPNDQMNAILARIKLSSQETKNIFWHGLGSLLIEKFSDGKFSWADSVAVAQYYYDHILATPQEITPDQIAPALSSHEEA